MARVADALKGLTAYLHSENQRLDAEFKEQKIDMAAETIAKKFQQLPPDATIQDMQALQFEVIENAAQLGVTQESLPLISGMYNSAMQTRSLVEQEKHDEAFAESIQRTLGVDVRGMTGDQTMALFNAYQNSKKDLTTEDPEGRKTLRTFDVMGKETFKMLISPVTRATLLQEDFIASTQKARVTADLSLRNALILQQNKQQFALDKELGITGVAQFKGMKFLRTQTTPGKGQLYESAKGGGLFILEEGGLVSYQGDVVPRRPGQSTEDILDTLMKNTEFHQRQRFNQANVLAGTKEGREILAKLTGRDKFDDTGTAGAREEDKQGRLRVKSNVVTELENIFGRDDINERLKTLFTPEQLSAEEGSFGALSLFGLSFLNEKQVEADQYLKLPRSDYSNIASIQEWNRGSVLLKKFIGNVSEYAGVAGSVYNYINRKLGRPQNTPVTMSDVSGMDFDNQIYLNRQLSIYHKSDLTLESKVPTLDDITVPKKSPVDNTPVKKYDIKEGSISFPKRDKVNFEDKVERDVPGFEKYLLNASESFGDFLLQ